MKWIMFMSMLVVSLAEMPLLRHRTLHVDSDSDSELEEMEDRKLLVRATAFVVSLILFTGVLLPVLVSSGYVRIVR